MVTTLKTALAAMVLLTGVCFGQAKRPAASQPAELPARPAVFLERAKELVSSLKLTDAQKAKVDEIYSKAAADLKEMRADLENMTPPERVREIGEFFKGVKDDVSAQLNPEQLKLFEKKIEEERGRARKKMREMMTEPTSRPAEKKESAMMDDKMAPDMMSAEKKERVAAADEESKTSEPARSGPGVGDRAPDFSLKKTDGNVITLASMKGRIVVVEFGSYSCPVFRQKAAAMEELKSQMGQRATFLVIYSKEAHPTGKWDVARNKNEGVAIEDASDAAARKSAATNAKEKLKITIPIALDEMNNSVADAYGLAPNGAVIIGRDGNILAKQKWVDPFALRIALDSALAAKPSTRPTATGG